MKPDYDLHGDHRVTWQNPTKPDRDFDLWPDRESAESIAQTLLRAGCRDVRINGRPYVATPMPSIERGENT